MSDLVTLHEGDNREVLKDIASNSVDAIVTDPPYGLSGATPTAEVLRAWLAGREFGEDRKGFMGKAWDGFVPGPAVWRQCYRVLKPGGYLLAFFGTRTEDLGSIAIRLGGFERRDLIAWLYGSGFPKSLDLSKAIDARDAEVARRARAMRFTEWMRSTGLSAKSIDQLTQSAMGSHLLTAREQPQVATAAMFDLLRPHMPPPPAWVEEMVRERTVESENLKARRVLGKHDSPAQAARWREDYGGGGQAAPAGLITAPHTPEAVEWEGWGTALKPALEPIVFAQKPLGERTYAANVLRHGVGGINIDGCRVEGAKTPAPVGQFGGSEVGATGLRGVRDGSSDHLGRWPANVVHDGSEEVEAAFPQSKGGGPVHDRSAGKFGGVYGDFTGESERFAGYDDLGSAARFFYSAKADAEDRMGSAHATVKPVELMRWLVRLITPPGGVVLDPFAGSGTTGAAAMAEGLRAILIEREADHCADIRIRLEHLNGRGGHSGQLKTRNKKPKGDLPLFGGAE